MLNNLLNAKVVNTMATEAENKPYQDKEKVSGVIQITKINGESHKGKAYSWEEIYNNERVLLISWKSCKISENFFITVTNTGQYYISNCNKDYYKGTMQLELTYGSDINKYGPENNGQGQSTDHLSNKASVNLEFKKLDNQNNSDPVMTADALLVKPTTVYVEVTTSFDYCSIKLGAEFSVPPQNTADEIFDKSHDWLMNKSIRLLNQQITIKKKELQGN